MSKAKMILCSLKELPLEELRYYATNYEVTYEKEPVELQEIEAMYKEILQKSNKKIFKYKENKKRSEEAVAILYKALKKLTKVTASDKDKQKELVQFYVEKNPMAKTALKWLDKFPDMVNPLDPMEQRSKALEAMQTTLMLQASEGCIASASLVQPVESYAPKLQNN